MSRKKGGGRQHRPVDRAMAAERPEKITMRRLWTDLARAANGHAENMHVPLYLTTCGKEGQDIQALIDHGLIRREESGAIAQESFSCVVAIERNQEAILQLKKRFPGLTIRRNLDELLRGETPIRFPRGQDIDFCRAAIVNLDLNAVFEARQDDAGITFPVLAHINKLSQIHALRPRVDWHLCLTLHGEITWSREVCTEIREFLIENFERDQNFALTVRQFLGDEFCDEIVSDRPIAFDEINTELQQSLLMVVVPKKIANSVNAHGWIVRTIQNLRYGGTANRAPMVSWIFRFESDLRASRRPQTVYIESLRSILNSAGYINDVGTILTL